MNFLNFEKLLKQVTSRVVIWSGDMGKRVRIEKYAKLMLVAHIHFCL